LIAPFGETFKALRRDSHQFGNASDIPVCVGDLGMADVRRQGEYCPINVNAFVVPVDQTMTDKGVTQILKARRGVVAARFPTELLTQSGKGVFDCATAEPSAARGEKEHLCLERRRNRLVAKARVTRQRWDPGVN
jgi:hypothetical protein